MLRAMGKFYGFFSLRTAPRRQAPVNLQKILKRWASAVGRGIILSLCGVAWTAVGGEWSQTTSLPTPVWGHSLVYSSGFLYQVGGGNPFPIETNVFYAPVQSGGTIGAWKTATP